MTSRLSFILAVGSVFGPNALGCAHPSAAPTTASPKPARAEPAASKPTGTTCRDWSDLDLAGLPVLPASPYAATFDQAWRTIHTNHYDPTLGCLDWPAIRTRYAQQLTTAKDDTEAYAIMNTMLGELGQSHLAIVPPHLHTESEPRSQTTDQRPARITADVRLLGDDMVVVEPAMFGVKSGLPGGAILLAVDDHEVAPALTGARKTWSREVEVAFHMARSVSGWLGCPAKGSRTIRYRTAQSPDERSKRFRCRQPEIERADMGNVQGVPILEEHRMLEGKVGYLRFNIWLLPLMPRIEQAMIELREQGMQALVLDLRGNPGGVGMMVVPLARLLLSESQSLGRMQMRAATQEFNVVAGGGEPFTGRVAVLIDERTASTSEIFAQSMRDLERVRVFGSGPSQGAALPSLIEELPGGAILQYVVADYRSPKGTAVEGAGVTPDVVVAESPADFAAGRDPVRDAAVQALAHRP